MFFNIPRKLVCMDSQPTNEKILIAGFPSTGLVGAFAISYLVKSLNMERVGELDFPEISPSYAIRSGDLFGPIQIYKKDNVYAVLSWLPLDSVSAYGFIRSSIEFAKKNNVTKIIVPRGMEVLGKNNTPPKSFGLTVSSKSKSLLKEYDLPLIPDASIFGGDAGVVSALKNSEIPSLILYTICRIRYPDAEAIIKAIETIARILKVDVDTEHIETKLEKISKENERLIEEAKQSMQTVKRKPASMPSAGIG